MKIKLNVISENLVVVCEGEGGSGLSLTIQAYTTGFIELLEVSFGTFSSFCSLIILGCTVACP